MKPQGLNVGFVDGITIAVALADHRVADLDYGIDNGLGVHQRRFALGFLEGFRYRWGEDEGVVAARRVHSSL